MDTAIAEKRTSGQIIWGALVDLRAQGQIATRPVLAAITGLKMGILDDHLQRFIDNGDIRRPVNGVFEIVEKMPPPRAVSMTHQPDGPSKLEIGDVCVDLWPQERRALASLLLGDAVQYSNIQAGQEINFVTNQIWAEVKKLKRDLGA
jgi:hypothetical protein